MKIDFAGEEVLAVAPQDLWHRLNDPNFLARCIPGCTGMTETAPDAYRALLQLRVASVGGSFAGDITLADKTPPTNCTLVVSGSGTLGHGSGTASFTIMPGENSDSRLLYQAEGEVGGLVAGVGQRILRSVAKHLIGKFFTAARTELAAAPQSHE